MTMLFSFGTVNVYADGINDSGIEARVPLYTAKFPKTQNVSQTYTITVKPYGSPLGKDIGNVTMHATLKYDEVWYVDANGNKIGDKAVNIKILAGYHQYFAVKKAVEKTKLACSEKGDKKAGVIWHTQGSGKSFSMVFYAAQLVKQLNNPTIVVLTDRNDLDDQLFGTFAKSADILRQTPKQADVRKLSDEQKQSNVKAKDNKRNNRVELKFKDRPNNITVSLLG